MAHKLVGDQVTYTRPVIIKPGFQRMDKDNNPQEVAADVRMVAISATVVGVEPRYNDEGESICPNLHLAFLHPDRLHSLSGSGWREAFDRALSVPPASHPDRIEMTDKAAFYVNDDVEEELYQVRRAKLKAAAEAADAEAKAKAAAEATAADQQAKDAAAAKAAAEVPAGGPVLVPAPEQPSAADLDAVAADEAAAAATAGPQS